MAGMFGLFDYSKPGKGVDKNAPQKKRFFHFFELYFRKFWKLIALNLMYLLFCIPIVTIGPATSAMVFILKNFTMERPVFLWSDFVDAFKKNWKQSVVLEIIAAFAIVLSYVSGNFYYARIEENKMYYVPLIIILSVSFVVFLAIAYMHIMIPVLDMKFKPMFKNAIALAILGIKTNLITTVFVVALYFLMFFFFPYTLIVMLLLFFSTVWFIITFNSFQYIEKFIINPYYEQTGEKRPDILDMDDMEEDDFVFEDIGSREVPVETKTQKRGKTIS
jgi:uncharacterized membrane protein YesL